MQRIHHSNLAELTPPPPLGPPRSLATGTADILPTRSAVRHAIADFGPHSIALIPFALAIGSASALNGLSLIQTLFAAVFLMAGAAQLAAIELIGDGTDALVVVATIILINLRFVIYGAGLARWFSAATIRQKMALSVSLVDQTFLSCEERFATMFPLTERRRYYVAGSIMLLSAFMTSQVVGYLVGPNVPEGLGLHLAAPLAFAGMLAKSIQGRPHLAAAAAASIAMVLCAGLPGGLALPIAIVVGLAAGSHTKGASSK